MIVTQDQAREILARHYPGLRLRLTTQPQYAVRTTAEHALGMYSLAWVKLTAGARSHVRIGRISWIISVGTDVDWTWTEPLSCPPTRAEIERLVSRYPDAADRDAVIRSSATQFLLHHCEHGYWFSLPQGAGTIRHSTPAAAWEHVKDFHGWRLFDIGGSEMIQRDDEMGIFASDVEAIEHVRRLAAAGSSRHQKVLATHDATSATLTATLNEPAEYLTVVRQAHGVTIQDENQLEITTAEYARLAEQILAIVAARSPAAAGVMHS